MKSTEERANFFIFTKYILSAAGLCKSTEYKNVVLGHWSISQYALADSFPLHDFEQIKLLLTLFHSLVIILSIVLDLIENQLAVTYELMKESIMRQIPSLK